MIKSQFDQFCRAHVDVVVGAPWCLRLPLVNHLIIDAFDSREIRFDLIALFRVITAKCVVWLRRAWQTHTIKPSVNICPLS